MNFFATLARLKNGAWKTKGKASGQSVVVQSSAAAGEVRSPEVFHSPGIIGNPADGDIGVQVYTEGARVVVIAVHNYRVKIDLAKGESVVYSTDAAGTTLKAKVLLKADGTIEMNGNSKTFVTHSELNTALQNFITALNLHVHSGVTTGPGASGPPGAPMSLDISGAATTTIKTGG